MATRLGPLWPALAVLTLLAVLYPGSMFQGHVFGGADTAASESFRQVGDAAREAGDYPCWNPFLFGGMPTFGSLAYTLGVYPPTMVFEFLQNRLGMPPLTWLLGHLFLGGLGVWWLLGRWHVPWAARLLACGSWLWFARIVAWGVHGHGTKLGAAMAMPWLLGLAWEILARGRIRAVGVAGLILGLQFLRGHVQISYYTLLLLGALTVWSLVWPLAAENRPVARERWRRAGLMVVVVAVGFALGSVLLLPVHDYAGISTRGAGGASGGAGSAYDYATSWSLAPEDLAAVVVPAAAGFGKATYVGRMPFNDYPNYLGFLILMLAAAAWSSGRRSLVTGLGVLGALGVLLAMGRFSPGLYQLCYEVLPYFDKFRVPSMAMVVPALAVTTLAGLGAAALAGDDGARSRWLPRLAIVALGLGALLALGGGTGLAGGPYREYLAQVAARAGRSTAPILLDTAWGLHQSLLIRQGLILLVAGGAFLLAARRPQFQRVWLVPVLAVLVLVDLGSVARLVTHPERSLHDVVRTADGGGRLASAARLERPWRGPAVPQLASPLATSLAREVGHDRVLPLGPADATSNVYMTAGIRSLGGYHPAKPAAAEAVRRRLYDGLPAGRIATWLAAAAVTSPGPLTDDVFALLSQQGLDLDPTGIPAGPTTIYRVRGSLPRARLVDAWQPASVFDAEDGLEPFLDAVASGDHDPRQVVVLDQQPDPQPQSGPKTLPRPEFLRDGLDEVVLRAAPSRPALLLLADTTAPGWRVTVDDEPATLLVADFMLRAVALPAGEHEVRFTYRDPALRRGLILAAVGSLAALLLLIWPLIRPGRSGVSTSVGE